MRSSIIARFFILLGVVLSATGIVQAAEIGRIAVTDTEVIIDLENSALEPVRIYELEPYQDYSVGNPPLAIYTGSDDGTITLPREAGGQDRLYKKFQLTDYANREAMGDPKYVTDLDGLSRHYDGFNGWAQGGLGGEASVADGSLRLELVNAEDLFVYNTEEVNADAAPYFVMRIRLVSPDQDPVPCAVYSFSSAAFGRQPFSVNATGEWQVVSVDLRNGEQEPWEGTRTVRLDMPEGLPIVAPDGSAFAEVDWIAVTADSAFDGSAPETSEAFWDFTEDHNFSYPVPDSIKGLQVQMVQDAIDLGVNHAGVNLLVNQVIDPNETSLTWEVDGETFGINQGTIAGLDATVKPLSDAGMTVALILLNAVPTSDDPNNPFIHPETNLAAAPNHLGAFNLTDQQGLRAYRAAIEFIAHRYSAPDSPFGWASQFIVGNEVNSHWWWYNMGEKAIDAFMADYERTVRITDLAVRRYHAEARAFISLEHHWNIVYSGNTLRAGKGREIIELMSGYSSAGGDYPWMIAFHPYPENLFDPEFWKDETALYTLDTPRITFKNIELLPVFLQQEDYLYQGSPRHVILSEQGFHTPSGENGQTIQAAAYALAYHRLRNTPRIDSFILHRHVDHRHEGGLLLGLWTNDPQSSSPAQPLAKKEIYEVFRLADTPDWEDAFSFALPVIGIDNWDEGLPYRTEMDFHFDSGAEGWQATSGVSGAAVSDGALSGTSSSASPLLEREEVFFLGDVTDRVYLRIRATAGENAALSWSTTSQPNGAGTLSIPLETGGEYHVYILDLEGLEGWAGEEIISLALQPTDAADAQFDVDFMLAPSFGSDLDGDGLLDAQESEDDTDGDGLPDLLDEDADGDGLLDGAEGTDDVDGDGDANFRDTDSDGDDMSDAYEDSVGLEPYRDDADEDADEDGFTNAEEHQYGTHPLDDTSFPSAAKIAVDTTAVTLNSEQPSVQVNLTNSGMLPLHWQAESNHANVTVSPAEGTGEAVVTIEATDFSADSSAEVTLSNDDDAEDQVTIAVTVERAGEPSDLAVSTNQLTLDASSPNATFNVLNQGEQTLAWEAASDDETVTVSPENGTGETEVTVAATDFTQDRTVNITVANQDNLDDTETVVVHVEHTPVPSDVAVSTNQLSLTVTSPSTSFNVTNQGELLLNWFAESSHASVTVSPGTGQGDATITVEGLDFSQDRTVNVTVGNSDNAADRETVVVTVHEGMLPGDLEVSTNLLSLTSGNPSASFNVLNEGEATLSWTAQSDLPAVTVTPASGTGPTTVDVSTDDFTQDRTANITVVNDDDSEDTETVVVQIEGTPLPDDLDLSTNAVTLTESSPTATVNVINLGEETLAWTAESDDASVSVDPASGTGAMTITLTASEFKRTRTVNVTVSNENDATDTETIVVTVQASGSGSSCAGGGAPSRGSGDALLLMLAAFALFLGSRRSRASR